MESAAGRSDVLPRPGYGWGRLQRAAFPRELQAVRQAAIGKTRRRRLIRRRWRRWLIKLNPNIRRGNNQIINVHLSGNSQQFNRIPY